MFPATSEKSFLALASVLENTGVGAYNGAAPSLQSKQVLASAGSIVQIEARHAAAIDLLIGKSPTPNQGFDRPLTKATVLGRKTADKGLASGEHSAASMICHGMPPRSYR